MDHYDVALEVLSRTCTLSEISAALGRRGDASSVEKGDLIPAPLVKVLGKRRSATCWRIGSGRRRTVRLDSQIKALLAKVPADFTRNISRLRGRKKALMVVGVFTQRIMKTFRISNEQLRSIAAFGCDLEVVHYNTRDQ